MVDAAGFDYLAALAQADAEVVAIIGEDFVAMAGDDLAQMHAAATQGDLATLGRAHADTADAWAVVATGMGCASLAGSADRPRMFAIMASTIFAATSVCKRAISSKRPF